ncbi:MAG: DUF4331 family protein [Chloroflexi bacterium]|nr:DUF4331 family protein [Chloroflexota bacterium]
MLKRLAILFVPLALVAALVLTTNAADHRDSPSVEDDPAADITDVYAFRSPANDDNLVVALDVNGLTPPAELRNFAEDVTYALHVDGTGDLVADANVEITFSGDTFTIEGLGDPISGDVTAPGSTEAEVTDANGIKVFAGPRDDPFFFDLVGFKNFVAELPVPALGLRPAGETPVDQFAGTNISAIVIELPITAVTGADSSDTGTIKAWATTSRGASQVDRMAIPAINTALIPSDQKDAFNQADPADDAADFRATGQATIETLRGAVDGLFGTPQDGGPLGDLTAEQVATALIPDVVTIDFSQPVQFPNGRRLQDDVINAALGVVLNRGGSAGISDAIDSNDEAFSSSFPYMAAPHTAPVSGAPSTGTGGPTGGDSGQMLWFVLGGLAAGVALLGGGLYLRRARA